MSKKARKGASKSPQREQINVHEISLTEKPQDIIFGDKAQTYLETCKKTKSKNREAQSPSPNILLEDAHQATNRKKLDEPMLFKSKISPKKEKITKRDKSVTETTPSASQLKQRAFEPSNYVFKKKDYNFKQEMFMEQFFEHKKANKTRITQQLTEMTYLQVLKRFEQEKKHGNFPHEFQENEMLWAGQLMRSRRLQHIMADMTDRIAQVLNEEIKSNREFVSEWLRYPHSHSQSQSPQSNTNSMSLTNSMQLSQCEGKVWYPEQLSVIYKQTTARDKHRQMIENISAKNKEKRRKQKELEEAIASNSNNNAKKRIDYMVNQAMHKTQAKTNKPKKFNDKKDSKAGMTPFQEAIHEHLKNAKEKIDGVDFLADEFQDQLDEIATELRDADKERAAKNQPGKGINNLISRWAEEPIHTPDQLNNYMYGPVMNIVEIEKFIKCQQTGLQIELKEKEKQYRCRVDGVRNHTQMQIAALESALIETKIKLARERERAEMRQAEMESTLYNAALKSDEAQRVEDILQAINDPTFEELDDRQQVGMMRIMLQRMQKGIESLTTEKMQNGKEILELKDEARAKQELFKKAQDDVKEWLNRILFYQDTLFQILERTGMLDILKDRKPLSPINEENKALLRELQNMNAERIRLDEEMKKTYIRPDDRKALKRLEAFVNDFHEAILEVDFAGFFQCYQEMVNQKVEKIEQITTQFSSIGFVDLDRLEHRKRSKEEEEALEQERSATTSRFRSNMRQPTGQQKKKKRVQHMQGLKLDLSQHQITEIHESFNELTKPLGVMMQQAIQLNESGTITHSASVYSRDGANQLGPEVDEYIRASQKDPANRAAYIENIQRKQALKDEEQQKKERRQMKRGQKNKNTDNSMQPVDILKRKIIKNRYPSGTKNQNAEKQGRTSRSRRARDKSGDFGDKSRDELSQRKSLKVTGTDVDDSTTQHYYDYETSDIQDSISLGSKTPKSNRLLQKNRRHKSEHVKNFKKRNEDSSEEDYDQYTDSVERDYSQSSQVIQNADSRELDEISGKDSDGKDQKQKDGLKKKSAKRDSLAVPSGNEKKVSSRNVTSRQGAKKDSVSKKMSSFSNQQYQYGAEKNLQKKAKGIDDRKVSVSIKKNQEEEAVPVNLGSGTESDDADTEPIYRLKEVIQELENKILLKYKLEYQEVQNEPQKVFKLKAGHNREVMLAFVQSLGEVIQETEQTEIINTGNLEDMIVLLNSLREKYIVPYEVPKGIKINPLSNTQKDQSYDWSKIPLADCILTQMNEDGSVTGFSIRPELMKIIMYREEGRNVSFVSKVVRSVNYLNRIFFKYNEDYLLGKRGQADAEFLKQIGQGNEMNSSDSIEQQQQSSVQQLVSKPSSKQISQSSYRKNVPLTSEKDTQSKRGSQKQSKSSLQDNSLLSVIQKHVSVMSSMGDKAKKSSIKRITADLTIEELMEYKLANIFEDLDEDDKEDMSSLDTSGLTVQEYLSTLFEMLERKFKTLPRANSKYLSMNELVFYGQEKVENYKSKAVSAFSEDLDDPDLEMEITKRVTVQLEAKYKAKLNKELLAKSKQTSPFSRYSQHSLAAQKKTKNVEAQTTDDLVESLVKERNDIQNNVAKQFINQQVAKEMNQTISTLYEYIDKLQTQNKEREENQMKMRVRATGPLSLFQDTRGSMATQISSLSPATAGSDFAASRAIPKEPQEQRKAINAIIASEIQALKEERKTNTLRSAEQKINRRQVKAMKIQQTERQGLPTQQSPMLSKQINLTLITRPKLPRLGKDHQQNENIRFERNFSQSLTCEVGLMPQLHNSSTKASVLVQQPFKQKHIDKRILNDNSTQSNVRAQVGGEKREIPDRRSQSGFNPPGLTARKIDALLSPMRIKENDVHILDRSLESKDFVKTNSVPDQFDVRKSQNNTMLRAKITTSISRPGRMLSQMAPFRASMDTAVQRAQIFTPETSQDVIKDSSQYESKNNYVSVMYSMRSTPHTGITGERSDNDAAKKNNKQSNFFGATGQASISRHSKSKSP